MSRVIVALLVLAVLIGVWVRMDSLGVEGFWTDEYFHVFAARSLLENGDLSVPYRTAYTRSLPTTLLTAASFAILGESEFTARLPFVLCNLALIALFYLFASRVCSRRIALIGACVLLLCPFEITLARECRMYTLFQLVFLGLVGSLTAGIEPRGDPSPRSPRWLADLERQLGLRFAWLVLAVALFALSSSVHRLTVMVVAPVLLHCAIMASWVGWRSGPLRALQSGYARIISLILVAGTVATVVAPDTVGAFWRLATRTPDWTSAYRGGIHFYRRFLADEFPGLMLLYPLGAGLMLARWRGRGLFLALVFLVPVAMHSTLFARRETRYLFYVFPFFVLAAAVAIEWLGKLLLEQARRTSRRWRPVVAVALLAVMTVLVSHPWLVLGMQRPARQKHTDYKQAAPELRELARGRVTIATGPRHFLYYVGSPPTFYFVDEPSASTDYPDGLIRSYRQLEVALQNSESVMFVGTRWTFLNDAYLTSEMRELVLGELAPFEHSGDPSLLVFYK